MDDTTVLYIGVGGISVRESGRGGGGGMKITGGSLASLNGVINLNLKDGFLELFTGIADNGNIKTSIEIRGAGKNAVYLQGERSNAFTGSITIVGESKLSLGKTNGAIAVSGNMNVKSGAKVISHGSGQIAKHVHVALESRGDEPASQLILENGVQESFHKLTIDGRGVLEFKGSSKLILDDLSVGGWDILTVVGWEHNKDLFLVRKTSTHVKNSLDNIIFQGQSGRVHLEDYNKDYWELTTAPEPTTTGAIIGVIIAGISIRRNRLEKTKEVVIC